MRKATSPRFTVTLSILLILNLASSALAGISFVPGQGVVLTGADGVVLTGADGVVLTGADGVVLTGADGVVLTGADGVVLTGADGVVLTGADGVVLTGADSLTYTRPYGVVLTGADSTGIKSIDPELAMVLNLLPDSSAINVFIIFHRMPADADFAALRSAGIMGGTRFQNLPIVLVNATKTQIATISALSSVRSIYSNKTLEFFSSQTREITGQKQVLTDRVLTQRNGGMPVSGRGVTVAVLDTGIDATHPDLGYGTQVIDNVRVADLQGTAPTFTYPQTVGGLQNSDFAMGHGTFVASLIAGTGAASSGTYGGMAPGARLLGISAGDASLFFVLAGMDYILSNRLVQNIRVVNCSFGISGVFDAHDPVNVATKILHDAGITVVFSAGNRGDQPNSLNPYSVAPWVIGVGSTDKSGSLSSFSSRGAAGYGVYHPTLVAPGENVVSARAAGVNVLAVSGLAGALNPETNEAQHIAPAHLLRYTMSSGTSFAAPHVAGTAAMMLQVNQRLTPDQIKNIIQETATPMLGYSRYEVGAGNLNAYAAVRKAAFNTPFGQFRNYLNNSQVKITRDQIAEFKGSAAPGSSYTTRFNVPTDAVFATIEIGWVRNADVLNNLKMTVSRDGQVYESRPASLLAGVGFQRSGITINDPAPGEWTLTVTNVGGPVAIASQPFSGAIELFRGDYREVSGITHLSPKEQYATRVAVRRGLISASRNGFGGDSPASRIELARALMLAGGTRVPQYLPYTPTFSDLPSDASAIFVESTVRSLRGNLFGATGAYFYPQGLADRLTTAVAAVRLLGLEQQAQAASQLNPGLSDWNSIPAALRGYVSIAVSHNLLNWENSGSFRPFDSITRAELAVAALAIQQATR